MDMTMRPEISNDKKITVFSDLHLDTRFDNNKCRHLLDLISNTDQVIINGDFWDNWYCTFREFINSDWKIIFPHLLGKSTVYIHGNHDPDSDCDNNVFLFCKYHGNNCVLKSGKEIFRFEHGHLLYKTGTSFWVGLYFKFINALRGCEAVRVFYKIVRFIETTGVVLFGSQIIYRNKIGHARNRQIKQAQRDYYLICGDMHHPDLDPKARYANTGFINYHYSSYITIENGIPTLNKTNY